jgi:transposase
MENRNMFVGLDVHKETIDVSIAEGHRDGEVRHSGVIASALAPLDKVVRPVGPSVRRGAITKAGNPHVRRLLAEAAWAYQGIPRIVSMGTGRKGGRRSCVSSRGRLSSA